MTFCGTCIYWHLHPGCDDEIIGACKRYPPNPNLQLVFDLFLKAEDARQSQDRRLISPHPVWWSYPVVDENMPCCGEYNPEVKQ